MLILNFKLWYTLHKDVRQSLRREKTSAYCAGRAFNCACPFKQVRIRLWESRLLDMAASELEEEMQIKRQLAIPGEFDIFNWYTHLGQGYWTKDISVC